MLHSKRFPNESAEYRRDRDLVLVAERDLRDNVERVAKMRRALPVGGEIPCDYVFQRAMPKARLGEDVLMSELFGSAHNTLLIYSLMFGPAMERPCPLCTSIVDSLDGAAPHVNQRATLVVVAKSPAARIAEFAEERGWRNVSVLSSAQNTFNADYHAETQEGGQVPMLTTFVRQGQTIRHASSTELEFLPAGAGQDARHVDSFWPLWNLLDLTPEGRGADWHPQLSYPPAT